MISRPLLSASTSHIIKETSFLHDNYKATLVQIDNTKRTDNYLYFNLTGQATVQNPQGYIIIYGCHGLVTIFDSSLYDNIYTDENDMMKLNSDINMNNHKIRNLQKPVDASDAVRKSDLLNLYVNIPIKKENAFKYLMDNNEGIEEQNITIHGINNYNNSIHFYNKKAYYVAVTKTPGSNNYDSIISFNTLSLDDNDYCLIIEWFHPEKFNRFVNVTGSNINILEQFDHEFQQYIRTLVQFTKNNNNIPNRLRINLKGTILGSDLNGYLILYGVKGLY